MPDSQLILPHDVEGVLVQVIGDHHAEHLAKLERARGVDPRTYEGYATVVRMADTDALRLGGDTVPACLLGIIGAPELTPNEDGGLDAVFQLGMQVTVMGTKRRDTLLRRDAMAWTTIECVLQRTPRGRGNLINSLRLMDYEPLAEVETQRTVGDARIIFEVGVANFMSATAGLPPSDSDWPPEAGGAPADSYDPIPDRPSATPTFTIDRRPIVE